MRWEHCSTAGPQLSLSPVPAMYTVARRPAEVVQKTRRGESSNSQTTTPVSQASSRLWSRTIIILGSLQSRINVYLQYSQTRQQSDMSACQLFIFPHCWKYLGSPQMTGSAQPSFPTGVAVSQCWCCRTRSNSSPVKIIALILLRHQQGSAQLTSD